MKRKQHQMGPVYTVVCLMKMTQSLCLVHLKTLWLTPPPCNLISIEFLIISLLFYPFQSPTQYLSAGFLQISTVYILKTWGSRIMCCYWPKQMSCLCHAGPTLTFTLMDIPQSTLQTLVKHWIARVVVLRRQMRVFWREFCKRALCSTELPFPLALQPNCLLCLWKLLGMLAH